MKKVDLKFNFASLQVSLPDQAGESVLAEIFKEREYKISEAAIAQAKHPILDVGAHVGLFSLYARLLNPNVEILAIEPEEKNFKILKENIKQNKIPFGSFSKIMNKEHGIKNVSSHNITYYFGIKFRQK